LILARPLGRKRYPDTATTDSAAKINIWTSKGMFIRVLRKGQTLCSHPALIMCLAPYVDGDKLQPSHEQREP
jgi:hypothetical protein